jgi:hypothetical protein
MLEVSNMMDNELEDSEAPKEDNNAFFAMGNSGELPVQT